jgi:hypothetical protein
MGFPHLRDIMLHVIKKPHVTPGISTRCASLSAGASGSSRKDMASGSR